MNFDEVVRHFTSKARNSSRWVLGEIAILALWSLAIVAFFYWALGHGASMETEDGPLVIAKARDGWERVNALVPLSVGAIAVIGWRTLKKAWGHLGQMQDAATLGGISSDTGSVVVAFDESPDSIAFVFVAAGSAWASVLATGLIWIIGTAFATAANHGPETWTPVGVIVSILVTAWIGACICSAAFEKLKEVVE